MKTKVGMAVTLYASAPSSLTSTSTLRNTTFVSVFSISSITGAIFLQGPHHSAKKSMTTSLSPAAAMPAFSSAKSLHILTILTSWFGEESADGLVDLENGTKSDSLFMLSQDSSQ